MKGLASCFVFVLLFVGVANAQLSNNYDEVKASVTKVKPARYSGIASVLAVNGGNRSGEVCLKVRISTVCLEWSATSTKFSGFQYAPQRVNTWGKGAKWQITYKIDKSGTYGELLSARFIKEQCPGGC